LDLEFLWNGFSSWNDHSAQNFQEPFVMRPVGSVRMTNESTQPQLFWERRLHHQLQFGWKIQDSRYDFGPFLWVKFEIFLKFHT